MSVALEDFDADRIFLQLINFAGERLLDHVAQQFAEAAGRRKTLRGEEAFELGANVGLGDGVTRPVWATEGTASQTVAVVTVTATVTYSKSAS